MLQGFLYSNETLQQIRTSIKRIEFDGEFKAVMDEVSNEMGI